MQTNLLLNGHLPDVSLLLRSDLYLTSRKMCVECPSECLLYPTVYTTFPTELSEEKAPGLSLPRSTHFLRRRPYSSRRSSREMGYRCMKLQKPPRVHSLQENRTVTLGTQPRLSCPLPPGPARTYPISYWRQQASLKSVTGESSAWIGWPLNQRLFKSITAFSASSSRRN